MSGIINYIINKFNWFWSKQKIEIEGYLMLKDSTTNKTKLLIKEGNNFWKASWYKDEQHTYKEPIQSIHSLFMKKL